MKRAPWKTFARGRTGQMPRGQMNKLESQYAEQLRLRHLAGEIEWFTFESITFTLAHSVPGVKGSGQRYTPDFAVLLSDGHFELHEVKGFRDEKNVNKFKVAAEMFPFRFVLVTKRTKKQGGGFVITDYSPLKDGADDASAETHRR